MKNLLSKKHIYFAVFGAVGGLLSAIMYSISGLDSPLASWAIGTGFDGLLIASLLAFAQVRYVGKSFDWRSLRNAMLIGGTGGIIGGLIALYVGFPLAFMLGGGSHAGRFLGWTLCGIAVGFAIARVVPNLKTIAACFAGAVGGFLGCGFMYLTSTLIAGTATTGAAIGLAIAYAETAFRQVWLDITIRPKGFSLEKERTITVTLGNKPVVLGCSGAVDVKLAEIPGTQPHFAQIFLSSEGKVIFLDMITNQIKEMVPGESCEVSNALVVLRTKAV